MKFIQLVLLLSLTVLGCSDQQRIDELTTQLENERKINKQKSDVIAKYLNELEALRDIQTPVYAYPFEQSSGPNIVKLKSDSAQVIDEITLSDSVDSEYVFDHTTTISQLKNNKLRSLFTTFQQSMDIVNPGSVKTFPYIVRVFILCEENGLPIETENCTDNIYILVQPTELGYESNLFKISRLFLSELIDLENTLEGVKLTIEHSKYPRKQLKVLIKTHFVSFLDQ